MQNHFNALTEAEAERLALLLEELGEAQQAIGKVLRHGYARYNPTSGAPVTNRLRLQTELGDVLSSMLRLCGMASVAGTASTLDLDWRAIVIRAERKSVTAENYMHHQERL